MMIKVIIFLLILLIPLASSHLTHDYTLIKETLIKIGLLAILLFYLLKALKERTLKLKINLPIFCLLGLAGYLIINFFLNSPPASSSELFLRLLFFSFFLSWHNSPFPAVSLV